MNASGSAPDTALAKTKQSNSALDNEDSADLFTLFEPNEDCIGEFGDIILVVNDGFHPVQKLRVSSCVLAMSSRVFKVLFSKRFSEGQRVKNRSAVEPQEIELLDGPVPMRQLCQLLHHQDVENLKSGSALLDFAILVGKYDCANKIRLQADALLQKHHDPSDSWPESYWFQRLLAVAFLLDQPRHFRHFGQQLVLRRYMLQANDFPEPVLELLPEKLVGSLFSQQTMMWHEIAKQAGGLIEEFRTACKVAGRQALLLELVEELCFRGVLPADPLHRTLGQTLHAFEEIEIPLIALTDKIETPRRYYGPWSSGTSDDGWNPQPQTPRRTRYRCRTGSLTSDAMTADVSHIDALTHKSLRERASRVRELCVGVCLDCIKGHECRQSHRHGWKELGEGISLHDLLVSHLDFDEDGNPVERDNEIVEIDHEHAMPYPGYWEECW
ncbi:putative BTB/POZ domain-containing protein [Septoria linicola]|nr:putative BTB/POZ domain-containing protein [Septoria linicola]